MSAYGKVQFVDSETANQETVVEEVATNSTMQEQVGKFDNSYEVKLQELYKEYDKITLDEEKVKSMTEIKVNAVKHSVSFRMGLVLTTSLIVAALLLFLCIYNIFVINGMSSNINYLQEEVATSRYELVQEEGFYNSNIDPNYIQSQLEANGFSEVINTTTITIPEKVVVEELQAETNWFDAICNFLSAIFG